MKTMKFHPIPLARPLGLALSTGLLALLSACGGGGNELGGDETLTLSQSELAVSAIGACYTGNGPTVYIYGGRPPYTLYNSLPDGMTLSSATVANAGDGFTIQFKGACMESMPITVTDDMGRITSLLITSTMEEVTTPIPTAAAPAGGN